MIADPVSRNAPGLDDRTSGLIAWLTAVAPSFDVRLAHPGLDPAAGRTGDVVDVRLAAINGGTRPKASDSALDLILDYAVTVSAADPLRAYGVLGEIAFGAQADPEMEMLGLPPALAERLGLVLRLRLRRDRHVPAAKRVRHRLQALLGAPEALDGVVLGPGNEPIPGAELTIPALGSRTTSDAAGHFRFEALPALPATLFVLAKGVRLELAAQPGEMLTVRVPLEA